MMEIKMLRCGAWSAGICVDRGANCISLRHADYGLRILREPDPQKAWDNPYLYGMPILFPVNRISGGAFFFEGREYRFPVNEPATGCHLHGELHQRPFAVTEESERHLRCVLEHRGEQKGFPHAFTLSMTYTLTGEGLLQTVEVENRSARNMPILLGFHTTFDLKGIANGDLVVGADVDTYVERNAQFLPTGNFPPADAVTRALQMSDFNPYSQPISRHYRAAGAGRITLWDRTRNVGILYESSRELGWRLIYNGEADRFICLEPQSCAIDCANAPYPKGFAEIPFIPPYGKAVYHLKIKLIKGENI